MRRTRRLFLLALVVIVGAVWSIYYAQKGLQTRTVPPAPPNLNPGIQALSKDWVYYKGEGNRPVVEVRAQDMERVEQPAVKLFLTGVQLKLYHKDGKQFDFVKSAKAEFDEAAGTLYSDGDVEVQLGLPSDEAEKKGRLLTIRGSGVKILAASGQVSTDRKTSFEFDLGRGEATGAEYDPKTRELLLRSEIKLHWTGREGQKPMDVETGRLLYRESESKVYLSPWGRLKRENLNLDTAEAVVTLEEGAIRLVEAQKAQGKDQYPNRQLAFGARELRMDLNEKSEVTKIVGVGDSRLDAQSATAITNIRTDHIDLDFDATPDGSVLKNALASGKSVVESKPIVKPGDKAATARIIKADAIQAKMRPGGEEIEAVETHSAGSLELVPTQPGQPRRLMNAERMWITYGAKNQLKSFRAVQVNTRTDKPAPPRAKTPPPPGFTWSRDLTAEFDERTGDMTKLDQWNDFRYQEGDRQATAVRASLDQKNNLITLTESARTWDASGNVIADRILLKQDSGDFTAEGNVTSTRMPDKKSTSGGGMLSQDEPIQGKARTMISKDHNQHVVYDGDAVLWQSGNRLQANKITIDRKSKALIAEGNVVSQLLDQKADPKTGKRVVTVVRAPYMRYEDETRLAYYRDGVRLLREEMDIKARELRAWLKEQKPADPKASPSVASADAKDKDSDSSLDRMTADGSVEIFQNTDGRTRRGTSDHAEYYVAQEKVVLNGGIAQMVDSVKGATRGRQLTYFSRNDTLQVEGAITQPAVSKIRRN